MRVKKEFSGEYWEMPPLPTEEEKRKMRRILKAGRERRNARASLIAQYTKRIKEKLK